MHVPPLAKLDDLWWLLPLGVGSALALWAYTVWFRRASERMIHQWAQENRLALLWLERIRVFGRNPAGLSAGSHDLVFRFAARSAEGRHVAGWISVGTTPASLRPGRISVALNDSNDEHP
jgi:hypothetical protein